MSYVIAAQTLGDAPWDNKAVNTQGLTEQRSVMGSMQLSPDVVAAISKLKGLDKGVMCAVEVRAAGEAVGGGLYLAADSVLAVVQDEYGSTALRAFAISVWEAAMRSCESNAMGANTLDPPNRRMLRTADRDAKGKEADAALVAWAQSVSSKGRARASSRG